jgi:Ca2+-binding RTX toxin-like protein
VHSLLGKILRIDINGDDFPGNKEKNYAIPSDNPFAGSVDGRGEIWDTGVRNPWRFSFDSKTGDFYLGDVGQNSWEEVDYLKAGHAGGVNFGWNYREGYVSYTGTPPDPHAFTDPVHVYSHHGGNAAITGGYVYRGPGEGLHGAYFYSDFMNDKIYTLRMVNGKAVDTENRTSQIHGDQISRISSYGTDADGNMFAVSLDGGIYRITPGKSSGDGSDNIHGGSGQDSIYGGAGNDRLNGDDGSDRLDGGLGNDRMTGGKGPDTFVFKADMGHDTVTDFAANGTHHDRLDLSGLPGIHDFHDLMAHHLTVKGNDLLIESGDRHILLQDVHQSALSGHDFIF